MSMIKANGAEFYCELHGKGQPVILVTGYTCDHQNWLPILDALAKQYQVLTLDNRAVGRTKDDGRELSTELMADDVIALAEVLELQKPHLVGSSMGGTIVQMAAARYPDKINKLVIMVSSAKWREATLQGLGALLAMRVQGVDVDLIIDATLPWVFGEKFLKDKATVAFVKKMIKENPYPQSLIDQQRQFKVLTTFDGSKQLSKIKAPTLVMAGKEDLLSLPYESKFLAEHIPQAELIELDCAHGLCAELPHQVANTLINFFDE